MNINDTFLKEDYPFVKIYSCERRGELLGDYYTQIFRHVVQLIVQLILKRGIQINLFSGFIV